jgi:hypothetical protein
MYLMLVYMLLDGVSLDLYFLFFFVVRATAMRDNVVFDNDLLGLYSVRDCGLGLGQQKWCLGGSVA